MKYTYFFILVLCGAFSSIAQDKLAAEQWREDVRLLQKTIHDDYPFLFKKVTAEDFDQEVEQLIDKIPGLQEHEIKVGMARLVALFGYGHTSIFLSGWYDIESLNFHQMPYHLYSFKDGIYIQGVSKEYENVLGARVLEIEGMHVEKALQSVKPAFPAENDQFFRAYGMSYLGCPEILHAQAVTPELLSDITLTLEKNGKTFQQTFTPIQEKGFPGRYGYINEAEGWLDARDNSKTPLYLDQLDRIYYYEYLPEHKTVYVRHSQIQDDSTAAIPEFYDEVFRFIEENDVEKFILDVRLNGGGNNYKNKPIVTGVIKSKINETGKFFVILGRRTFSACQNLVNELDNYTHAIFVGEPTGENINFYGDNRPLILPNSGLRARLSFAWWQDKPQWENQDWLAPHLAVEMTFDEYVSNQDPVLQAALEFSTDNFILDPMAHFTELYLTGQVDKIQSEAISMVNDPAYAFFDFEEEFNSAGYNLLRGDNPEAAIMVFELVAGLFPNSANAWDSLAEGYWQIGQIEKAIELYKKAIQMDPDGSVGRNAKEMLSRIEESRE